jgi:hypothetical protein
MSWKSVETVLVKAWHETQGLFVEINKDEFDPLKHELFHDQKADDVNRTPPAPVEPPAPAPETPPAPVEPPAPAPETPPAPVEPPAVPAA